MSDPPDWRQKYRDSLIEMEGEEKRWRQVEQALRRLVGRLCAAGMGLNPQLDDELSALAAANRRHADAVELERLAESLTSTVVAVDAVSPVPTIVLPALPAGKWDATCAAAGKILQCMKEMGADNPAALDLERRLKKAATDAELATILQKMAELIHQHGERLAGERQMAARVLGDVTRRLEEMAGFLAESGAAAQSRFADTLSVNDSVISQVRELAAEAKDATDLQLLQGMVSARLEAVAQQVLEFRQREERQVLEQAGRAERMRTRIEDLEREAQDLNSKLDREKHGARLDPLTRVANRKSFDERFEQEMERRSRSEVPVSMLLWDLDDFKAINDTYGHRAGDRVLQSVAACFTAGIRAEDLVARIGGEEFVMLLRGLPIAKALTVADELRAGVEALRFHFRGTRVRVTVSCGLSELRPGEARATAFDRADGALYRAKHGGKNLCVAD